MRICFIGDSLVNGIGDSRVLGWTGRVCRYQHNRGFDITCYNLGVRGETSADILKRWEAETIPRLKPEYERLAVFSFGVNDTKNDPVKPRVPLEQSIENTQAILNRAKELYAVMVVGPIAVRDPGHNERISTLSEHIASVCSRNKVPFLDIFTHLAGDNTWGDCLDPEDGIHPDDSGYDTIASLVLRWPSWQGLFQ